VEAEKCVTKKRKNIPEKRRQRKKRAAVSEVSPGLQSIKGPGDEKGKTHAEGGPTQ